MNRKLTAITAALCMSLIPSAAFANETEEQPAENKEAEANTAFDETETEHDSDPAETEVSTISLQGSDEYDNTWLLSIDIPNQTAVINVMPTADDETAGDEPGNEETAAEGGDTAAETAETDAAAAAEETETESQDAASAQDAMVVCGPFVDNEDGSTTVTNDADGEQYVFWLTQSENDAPNWMLYYEPTDTAVEMCVLSGDNTSLDCYAGVGYDGSVWTVTFDTENETAEIYKDSAVNGIAVIGTYTGLGSGTITVTSEDGTETTLRAEQLDEDGDVIRITDDAGDTAVVSRIDPNVLA